MVALSDWRMHYTNRKWPAIMDIALLIHSAFTHLHKHSNSYYSVHHPPHEVDGAVK